MTLNNEVVILLTACVNPNGMSFTVLQNSDERLCQYQNALDWYLKNTAYPIVFVENTNTYIGNEYQVFVNSGRLEFVTFQGNDFPRYLGKGYGEALIIKEALTNSRLMFQCKWVVKITGRLIVTNINSLIKESSKANTFSSACCATVKMCLSYVFITSKPFLDYYFIPRLSDINDSEKGYFEHILYDSVVQWIHAGHSYHYFYNFIKVIGMSGSTGLNYPPCTPKNVFRNFLKALYINMIKREKYIYGM